MYMFDIENKSLLRDVLFENLKILGVRCRPPKKIKENEKENVYFEYQIFQKPLHLLKKCVTQRLDGSTIEVPEFIVDACSVIEKDIKVEGIFRKAGSTCKQKERKLELNQGKKVSCEYHVLDACSLVKLFFRELPQPLIPFAYHDVLLKCLLLSTYEKEVDALLLAIMLLPEDNLATLAFFMEFLLKVSQHADKNKMNVKNLAIILTPTLMPLAKGTRVSNNLEMASHFKVIEMLIENSIRIGRVPDSILENLISINNKKLKKKRRSGSITRMFTGLKKIVSSKGSTVLDESFVSTPDNIPSLGKRKSADSASTINLSAKRRRFNDSSPLATPLRCRMQGYASSLHTVRSSLPSNIKSVCTGSPEEISAKNRETCEMRNSRLNLMRKCTTKRQKSKKKLGSSSSIEMLCTFETEKSPLENKQSLTGWGHKRSSFTDLLPTKNETRSQDELPDSEFITVPKSEYEEIKNRVCALEEDLEKLSTVHSVQTAFEKTLEEAERLHDGSAEQLAKRLSRELNIRRSAENRIVRSPSARKIGSIRRRSRESSQRSSEPKTNLKRGRPNTLQTGLPSPRHRTLSNENISSVKKTPVTRSATFREQKETWKSGEIFFSKENLLQKLSPAPQGRPSVAEIRCHNAGMVLEKAKLFNSLQESNGTEPKIPRRQSVRLENLRRTNDDSRNTTVTRTRSFGSERNSKVRSVFAENGISPKIKEDLVHEAYTPLRQRSHVSRRDTPSIKKPLVTRSPRTLAKTPLSQMRSAQRSRATPMKALLEPGGTPLMGLRRSPRILARYNSTPSRLKD